MSRECTKILLANEQEDDFTSTPTSCLITMFVFINCIKKLSCPFCFNIPLIMSSTNVTVFCIGAHTRTDFVNDICTGATDVRDLVETSC